MAIELRRSYADIPIDATDGIVTKEQVRKVFGVYIDSRLHTWKSNPTGVTKVAVSEVTRTEKGNFQDLFGKAAAELEKCRLEWTQVVDFCEDRLIKIRGIFGDPTFFLISEDGELIKEDLSNVFIVRVVHPDDNWFLEARLFAFSRVNYWHAKQGYRRVSPQ